MPHSEQAAALFESHPIRRIYDETTDTWWFSVVDVIKILTQQGRSLTARKYWNKLKQRLSEEGSQLVTNCHGIAKRARLELETQTGRKVVSPENYLPPQRPSKTLKQ